jgi:hypothetical protein
MFFSRRFLPFSRTYLRRRSLAHDAKKPRIHDDDDFDAPNVLVSSSNNASGTTWTDILACIVLSVVSGGYLLYDVKDLGLPQKKKKSDDDD